MIKVIVKVEEQVGVYEAGWSSKPESKDEARKYVFKAI